MKVLFLILILVMSFLQFGWIDMMTESKRRNLESEFTWRGEQFSQEFTEELSELIRAFGGSRIEQGISPMRMRNQEIPQLLETGWERWQENALVPSIISEVFVVTIEKRSSSNHAKWQKWDSLTGTLNPISPEENHPVFDFPDFPRHPGPQWIQQLVRLEVPGMLLPVTRRMPFMRSGRMRQGRFIFLVFDRDVMTRTLMPKLCQTVLGKDNYHSEMIRIRVLDEKERLIFDSGQEGIPLQGLPIMQSRFFPPNIRMGPANPSKNGDLFWKLELYHNKGSLDSVLASFSRTNKAIAAFVYLFLAGSIFLVIQNSRSAKQLAKKQLNFVAGISHELLTPLASIQAAGENMREGLITSPEKIITYGKMIEKESGRLNRLVTQILQFAKIESSDEALSTTHEDIGDVLSDAVQSCEHLLEEHGVTLETHSSTAPAVLEMNRLAVQRVFRNLIENACKYGASGKKIDVEIQVMDSQTLVRFTNYGPEITKEETRQIFEPFTRGSVVVSSHIAGTGLGLHIVKKIMDQHHGTVSLSSSSQKTVFQCAFPMTGDS